MHEVNIEIAGLGIILFSPPAVAHIPERFDYLQTHFLRPEDVAQHVMLGQLTTFATGSPGTFRLRFLDGPPDAKVVALTQFKLRLGLQVHAGTICVRDLYDLLDWTVVCPPQQQLSAVDGWYCLTVLTSLPSSGLLGDDQLIEIYMEPVEQIPPIRWAGVPQLCS